ncbi:MAG: glycosyltransferase family 39 protein [Nitrososphaeria archaeon]|nr:glycosyltransferase family 39 protein [Nitrososphaeria archaeon]
MFGRQNPFNKLRLILALLSIGILAIKLSVIPYPWPSLPPEQCIDEATPGCALIFDEAHYVRAVRKIMRGDLDVNLEHPPLAKLLIMFGIMIFGDNPWGWRLIPSICGTASIYLLGLIAYELTRNEKASLIAAALFGFDITCFNLGSIAILEPAALMFSLLGLLLFLRGRLILSGIIFGLALLSKLTAAFLLASILFLVLAINCLKSRSSREALGSWVTAFERTGFTAFAVFIAGLWPYTYLSKRYATPFEHLDFMLSYHGEMLGPNPEEGAPPLSWTNPISQFPRQPLYVIPDNTIMYYCLQTPLWWMTWVTIAFSLYLLIAALRRGEVPRAELLILSWFSFTYLIYFPIALLRPVYPFYFYMAVPAIAIGFSHMMRGDRLSEAIRYGLLAFQILWFIIFFPVKPQWLASMLHGLLW